MKPLRFALAVLAAVTLSTGEPRHATAADAQLAAGSIELTPTVAYSYSNLKREGYGNVETSSELHFTPSIGFCLTNHYEVIGGALIRHTSVNGMSDTNIGALAGLTYNFSRQGKVIPFAGAAFGVLFNDGFTFDDTAVLFPQITAGIRLLVGNSASANVSLGYERETDGNVRVNRMVSQIGVSLFPWHSR